MTVGHIDGMSLMLHHNIVDGKTCYCAVRTICSSNAKYMISGGWITQEVERHIKQISNFELLFNLFPLDPLYRHNKTFIVDSIPALWVYFPRFTKIMLLDQQTNCVRTPQTQSET